MIITKQMIRACEYKDFISPDEWALLNYKLEKESAVGSGKFSFKYAPHTRLPLEYIGKDEVREVCLWFASQAGKTTTAMIALNWYMDNVGGNAMFFLPSEDLVAYSATDRILPSINRTPNRYSVLEEKSERTIRDNTRNIRYLGGTIRVLSSTRSTNRKSTPAKFIILDEISEMKHIHVAEISERAKTYEMFGSKLIKTSTAMSDDDPIVTAFKTSEVKFEYALKCPYCNKTHIDDFLNNIRYPKMDELKEQIDTNLSEAEANISYAILASKQAHYACPNCNKLWDNSDKDRAVLNGGWQITSKAKTGSSVGFKASSLISRLVSINELTKQYLLADDDEKKAAFYRGWLNQIYHPQVKTTPLDELRGLKSELGAGELPSDCVGLFAGVDVQKDHYYFVVLAVDSKLDKHIIDYGRIENEASLINFVLSAKYTRVGDNKPMCVECFAIDSGFRSDEIYTLCHNLNSYFTIPSPQKDILLEARGGAGILALPVKGASNTLSTSSNGIGSISVIEKDINGRPFVGGLNLHVINTYFFKDSINTHMQNKLENLSSNRLHVSKECSDDLLKSLISESKQEIKKNNGQAVFAYLPTTAHPFNHYLDCLVYCFYFVARFNVSFRASFYQSGEVSQTKQKPKRRDYLDEF